MSNILIKNLKYKNVYQIILNKILKILSAVLD